MYGIGRRSRALIAENIVVDPPMPRATARMAMAVNPGVFTSIRQAYLRSRNMMDLRFAYMWIESLRPLEPPPGGRRRMRLRTDAGASHGEAAPEDITNQPDLLGCHPIFHHAAVEEMD